MIIVPCKTRRKENMKYPSLHALLHVLLLLHSVLSTQHGGLTSEVKPVDSAVQISTNSVRPSLQENRVSFPISYIIISVSRVFLSNMDFLASENQSLS